jgi:hypothetical protein
MCTHLRSNKLTPPLESFRKAKVSPDKRNPIRLNLPPTRRWVDNQSSLPEVAESVALRKRRKALNYCWRSQSPRQIAIQPAHFQHRLFLQFSPFLPLLHSPIYTQIIPLEHHRLENSAFLHLVRVGTSDTELLEHTVSTVLGKSS